MRVLFIGEKIRGDIGEGISNYEVGLIDGFKKLIDIGVIDTYSEVGIKGYDRDFIKKIVYLFLNAIRRLIKNPEKIRKGYKNYQKKGFSPDLIHYLNPSLVPLSPIKNKKSVVTFYDLFPVTSPRRMLSRGYARMQKKLFSKAVKKVDHIISISEQTKKDLIKYLKVPERKITVIPISIKEEFVKTKVKNHKKKREFIIGFLTSIVPSKRPDLAIKIFNKVNEKLPNSKLEIYGKVRRNAFIEKIKKMSHGKVYFKGFVKETERLKVMGGFDMFIYPSEVDGFGLPIIEAAALGIPVITMQDAHIPKEVVKSSIIAKDISDASKKMINLLKNTKKRNSFAKKIAKNTRKEFSWNKTINETKKVYEEILK
ncbi:MAG: glycosyltransferase family 4 protein [archaeon]|nr:MAG: glycosyltransferase family 4 protein [archaeon]